MTAGLNVHARIWRISFPVDDSSGGALPTGTVSYPDILGRLNQAKPNFLLLQQGMEIDDIFEFETRPPAMEIYERDELEIIYPTNHVYFGKHFRVVGVRRSSMHPSDSRGFMILTLRRWERAHVQQ